MKSTLVVVAKNKNSPSFRYRIKPLLDRLTERGWVISVVEVKGRIYLLRVLKFKALLQAADVVLCQKLLLPTCEISYISKHAKKLVYDIDDAIYIKQPKWVGHIRDRSKSRLARFNCMVRTADVVVVGNATLEEKVKAIGGFTRLLPTAIDCHNYDVCKDKSSESIYVVWVGLPANIRYLESLRSVFSDLTKKYPAFHLRVISSQFPDWDDVRLDRVSWTLDGEKYAIASAHIGIMPLDDSEYSRGKCAFKLLQYMSASLPCVASPVGANVEVIKHGVNGYLADTPQEWLSFLGKLIEDESSRLSLGVNGMKYVQKKYDQDVVFNEYTGLLESILAN
ncbi:MAG: glycosyltransferase involved in cell wall biosynthesis [Flavobacteriales bacterium]|jgi:glycosyltransferase involved in cell wall biosynthesis